MSRVIFSDGKEYQQTMVYLRSVIYELVKSSGLNVIRMLQLILEGYFDLLREDKKREVNIEKLAREVKKRKEMDKKGLFRP